MADAPIDPTIIETGASPVFYGAQAEPPKQNFLLYSNTFGNAAWTKQAGVTLPSTTQIAPDGTATATQIDLTAASANTGIYQIAFVARGMTPNAPTTRSVWVKGTAGETVKLTDPASGVGIVTHTFDGTWQILALTEPLFSGGGGVWLQKGTGNVFAIWQAQINHAARPSAHAETGANVINTGTPRGLMPRQNLLGKSEDMSNASWWVKNTGVTAAGSSTDVPAPPGGGVVTRITYTTGGGAGAWRIYQPATAVPSGRMWTNAIWLRTLSGTATVKLGSNGVVGPDITVTDQWQQFTLSSNLGNTQWHIYAGAGSDAPFVIYASRAQKTATQTLAPYARTDAAIINEGDPRGLVPQQNLAPQSNALDNAAWSKNSVTVDAAPVAGPDGVLDCWNVREVTSGVTSHYLGGSPLVTTVADRVYTLQMAVKPGTRDCCVLRVGSNLCFFNAATGAFGTAGASILSTGCIDLPDGFKLARITFRSAGSESFLLQLAVDLVSSSYAGDSTKYLTMGRVSLHEGYGFAEHVKTTTLAVNEGAPRPLAA